MHEPIILTCWDNALICNWVCNEFITTLFTSSILIHYLLVCTRGWFTESLIIWHFGIITACFTFHFRINDLTVCTTYTELSYIINNTIYADEVITWKNCRIWKTNTCIRTCDIPITLSTTTIRRIESTHFAIFHTHTI